MGRRAERTHSETDNDTGWTPKRAKNAVRVAKVIVPAAAGALAPLVIRAAGAIREVYDRQQARRMGVDVAQLPEYQGRGGALLARIAGAAEGLSRLADSPSGDGGRPRLRHPQSLDPGTAQRLGAGGRTDAHAAEEGRAPSRQRRAGRHRDRVASPLGGARPRCDGVGRRHGYITCGHGRTNCGHDYVTCGHGYVAGGFSRP